MSRILSTLPQGDGMAVCDNLPKLHGATATVVSYWQAHSSTVSSLHAISYPPSLLSSGSDGAKLWTPDGAVCYGTLRRSNADLGTRVWSFPEVEDVKEKQLKAQALQVLERLSSSEAQRLHSNLNQTGPSASFKEAAHAKLDRSLLSFSTPKDPTHARSAIIRDGGSLPSVLDIINEKSPGKDGSSARGVATAADASPPPLHLDLSVSLSARSSSEGFRYGGGRRSHAAAAATAAALSPRASLLSPRRAGGGGTSPLPHGNEAAAAAAERLEKLLAG